MASCAGPKDHEDNRPVDQTTRDESNETTDDLTEAKRLLATMTMMASLRTILDCLNPLVVGFQKPGGEQDGPPSE